MAVKLSKGQKVNLRKDNPNLKRVLVGLGWDPVEQQIPVNHKESGSFGFLRRVMNFLGISSEMSSDQPFTKVADIDIDASIICIDKKNCHKKTVYYGDLEYHKGAIRHYGDNLTGEGEEGEDDEQIEIKLDQIPQKVKTLSIIINIYCAYEKKQTFGQVKNCYVHVTDMDFHRELVRYDIDGNFEGMTGIFVADLERSGDEWHFKAIGEGVKVRHIGEMVGMKCKEE